MTETIGHVPHALEKMRQRALTLHGISIDMPDGPSSSALRDAADIGLKSVRVRRVNGTSAGFDVYLGGGIGDVGQRGLRYKLGVEIDQLPQLIEDVIREYYLTHTPGQTFSMYWRGKLRIAETARCGREKMVAPIWICDGCDSWCKCETPPLICPECAGSLDHFARLENGAEPPLKLADGSATPVRQSHVGEAQHDLPAFSMSRLQLQAAGS